MYERSGRNGADERADLKFDRLGAGMNSIAGRAAQDEFRRKGKGVMVWVPAKIDVEVVIEREKLNALRRRNDGYCSGSNQNGSGNRNRSRQSVVSRVDH